MWSTSALTIPPGGLVEVPLVVAEPSICQYVLASDTQIGFQLGLLTRPTEPAISEYVSDIQGCFEVPTAGVLQAALNNTASLVRTAKVACTVSLKPSAQLKRLEQHRQQVALQAAVHIAERELRDHSNKQAERLATEAALRAEEEALRERLEMATREVVRGERRAILLREEVTSLKAQALAARTRSSSDIADGDTSVQNGELSDELDADVEGTILNEEDDAAITRLCSLGFPPAAATEAYLSCRKDEHRAANFLIDRCSASG
eukprot:CAMPEP_0183336008 /NCGR_PEP_ID=MMETSP0164_2-20130417/4124_1 /TAXON_ID=221442 /ORGANISM="Coccolithus pelagicus ssp braarudi, Strain PLY182g" /LENGTH=261 /DNA_ID=CAMNT_0025505457 /DNA_START=68 /DNA_END=853 /DNA_ORIENTATION=-